MARRATGRRRARTTRSSIAEGASAACAGARNTEGESESSPLRNLEGFAGNGVSAGDGTSAGSVGAASRAVHTRRAHPAGRAAVRLRFALAVATALALALLTGGCRWSPALVQNVYTQDPAKVDVQHPVTYDLPDQPEKDDNADNDKDDDANRSKDKQQEAQQDEDAADDGASIKTDPADDADAGKASSTKASSKKGKSGSGGKAKGSGDGASAKGSGKTGKTSGNGTGSPNGDPNTSGDSDKSSSGANKGEGDGAGDGNGGSYPTKAGVPKKTVTNANGEKVEIPEDVFTTCAVDDAAPVVEMLAGSGRLLAADKDFTSNEYAKYLFDDVASGEVKTWWDGDGSEPISSKNFEALLKESPDCVFEVDGDESFTSAQVKQMQKLGIGYVVLPRFSSADNIKDAVQIVAQAVGTNSDTGKDARRISKGYADWVDDLVNGVRESTEANWTTKQYAGTEKVSANEGKKGAAGAVYVSGWHDDISYEPLLWDDTGHLPASASMLRIYRDSITLYSAILDVNPTTGASGGHGKGSGVATGWTPEMQAKTPLWEALLDANVIETSMARSAVGFEERYLFPNRALFGPPVYSSDKYYYPVVGSVKEALTSTDNEVARYYSQQDSANEDFALRLDSTGSAHDGGVGSYSGASGHSVLGGAAFKYVIAADEKARDGIAAAYNWKPLVRYENNSIKTYKLYADKNVYYYDSKTGKTRTLSVMDAASGSDVSLDYFWGVEDPYTIIVNPSGLKRWSEGGVEAPLESVWAAARIKGKGAGSLESTVKGFYKTFFGKDISTAQYKTIAKDGADKKVDRG